MGIDRQRLGIYSYTGGWCFSSALIGCSAECLPESLELWEYSFYTSGRYDGLAARGLHRTCGKDACNENQDILIQMHHSTIYHLVPDDSEFLSVRVFQLVQSVTSARTAELGPMHTRLKWFLQQLKHMCTFQSVWNRRCTYLETQGKCISKPHIL